MNLGDTLLYTRQFEEAARLAERFATLHEGLGNDYPEIHDRRTALAESDLIRAVLLIQSGDRADAASTAERLARIAWHICQREAPRVAEPADTAEVAGRALAVNPGSVFAHHVMGMARYRAGQWDEAIKELKKANELATTGAAPSTATSWRWPITKKATPKKLAPGTTARSPGWPSTW